MILFILSKAIKRNIIKILIQFLQIGIILYVSRRFLKLYITLERKDFNSHIYNTYFNVLVCVNIFFILASFAFSIVTEVIESINFVQLNQIFIFIEDLICAIIALILLLFSNKIRNLIADNIEEFQHPEESFLKDNLAINTSVEDSETREIKKIKYKNNEIYLKKRNLQLNIIAISNYVALMIRLIYSIMQKFIIDEQYCVNDSNIFPKSVLGYIFKKIGDFTFFVSTVTNYLAFYFVIRNNYNNESVPDNEKLIGEDEIDQTKYEIESTNSENIFNFIDDENIEDNNKKEDEFD